MKKSFLILFFTLLFVKITYAQTYDISQISQAKLVTQYSTDTTVDQMDTVIFGSYPQSDASGNTKDPIEWIVLDRQEDKALLLSKYILDCKRYNEKNENITWENCNLRLWLNNSFYNAAFENNEKSHINNTYVINNVNMKFSIGGNHTYDNIFLLSIDEVEKYFYQSNMRNDNKRLATRGTNYSKTVDNNGLRLSITNSAGNWHDGNSHFFLRTPGERQYEVVIVRSDGYLEPRGYRVNADMDGIRPAMWVNISSVDTNSITQNNSAVNTIQTNQTNNAISNITNQSVQDNKIYIKQNDNVKTNYKIIVNGIIEENVTHEYPASGPNSYVIGHYLGETWSENGTYYIGDNNREVYGICKYTILGVNGQYVDENENLITNGKMATVTNRQPIQDGDIVLISFIAKYNGQVIQDGDFTYFDYLDLDFNSIIGHYVGDSLTLTTENFALNDRDRVFEHRYIGKTVEMDIKIIGMVRDTIGNYEGIVYDEFINDEIKDKWAHSFG